MAVEPTGRGGDTAPTGRTPIDELSKEERAELEEYGKIFGWSFDQLSKMYEQFGLYALRSITYIQMGTDFTSSINKIMTMLADAFKSGADSKTVDALVEEMYKIRGLPERLREEAMKYAPSDPAKRAEYEEAVEEWVGQVQGWVDQLKEDLNELGKMAHEMDPTKIGEKGNFVYHVYEILAGCLDGDISPGGYQKQNLEIALNNASEIYNGEKPNWVFELFTSTEGKLNLELTEVNGKLVELNAILKKYESILSSIGAALGKTEDKNFKMLMAILQAMSG